MSTASSGVLLCALCALVVGCSQNSPPPPKAAVKDISTTPRETVKVFDHDGNLAFRLQTDKGSHKVFDGEETLLARLKDMPDHLQVEDEKRPLLRFRRQENKPKSWVVENMSAAVQLTFSQQADGGYEIKDGSGRLLYTVRRTESGFDVLDAKGKTLCRMTMANGRVVATRADGFKLYEIQGSKSMTALSALVMEKFNVTARAALFAFLQSLEAPA